MDDDSFPSEEDDSSVDSEEEFKAALRGISVNDPDTITLGECGGGYIDNFTDEEWEELGRDISNNTHLIKVSLYDAALNDHKMSLLFRGLTGSNSIGRMALHDNGLNAVGVRSMVPFFQRAKSLMYLDIDRNNVRSEGFNMLLRALRESPIEGLRCCGCGIESIEIDRELIPKHLKRLSLDGNNINADGCRELAKLLRGGDSTLTHLYLANSKIDDEGVGILVDALQKNTSLNWLNLDRNNGISKKGQSLLLKLVNNISSIKATMQSNHTLRYLYVDLLVRITDILILKHLNMATQINREEGSGNPAAAARAKVLNTQLNSSTRAELAELQGVSQSFYSEINPLYLPEVIALVGRHHGQGELYVALKSSIAGVISSVNRKQCLLQQKAHHEAAIAEYRTFIAEHRTKVETIEAEIEAIEEADGSHIGSEPRSSKRRRA